MPRDILDTAMRSLMTSLLAATALGLLSLGCGDLDTGAAAGSLRSQAVPSKTPVPKPSSTVRKIPKRKFTRSKLKGRGFERDEPAPVDVPEAPPAPPTPRKEEGKLAGLTDAHNQIREGVALSALEWSDSIGGFAQAWADHLATENECKLAHRPSDGPFAQKYGENIFLKSGPSNVAEVVGMWAAEASDYDHPTNTCSGICGHYTQIVWAATQHLGCGYRQCDGGGEIWVCNYDPRGNYYGQSPY